MLKRVLSQRLGQHVPKECHPNFLPKNYLIKSDDGKTCVKAIDPVKDSKSVKDFMFAKFYREAPIPIVLNLSRKCSETENFLDQELELFINSGVSIKFFNEENQVSGIGFSCIWTRNPKYEIIGAPVKAWHNSAAEIAKHFPQDIRHTIWRDLQWQHIHDLAQRFMVQSKKPMLFYLAMLYLNPEVRATKLAEKAIHTLRNENQECSFLCQSNFRGFDKSVERVFKSPVLLEEVKYSEEELVLNEDQGRAFQVIESLDGIRFYGDQ